MRAGLRYSPIVAVAILAVAASGNNPAVAEDYFPAAAIPSESVLPKSTIALATFPSVSNFRDRWDQSSFGQMATDPAFGPFFGDVRERVATLSDAFGLDVLALWSQVDGELSVALVPGSGRQRLTLVGIVNFDRDESAAGQWLRRLESQLKTAGATSLSVTAERDDGTRRTLTTWTSTAVRNGRPTQKSLAYYQDDGHVVVADGLPALLAIARSANPSESLKGSDAYQQVKSETQPARGSAAIRWYVNPAAAVDAAITSELGSQQSTDLLRRLVEKSGVNQFRGFGGLFDLPGGGLDSVTSTYGFVDGPPRGLLRAFAMDATRQQPPRWVKDDVSLYAQMNFEPQRLIEVVRETVDSTRGAGTFDATLLQQPVGGTDVTVAEIAQQIVGPIHFAAEVPESAAELTRQSTVISVGIRDPKQMAELIDRLAGGSTEQTETKTGSTVYTLPLTLQVPSGTPLTALAAPELAVAIGPDGLMFSTDGDYLTATLDGIGSGRSLAESPQYAEIARNYPEQTAVINYQRQDGRFAGLYEQLRSGGLPAVGTTGVLATTLGFDFQKLPPFSAMSRYLQSTGGFIVPAENGFRIVNFSLPPREQ